jgi:signal transduction histidine kinase/DNA-binding response OmpR family regulator
MPNATNILLIRIRISLLLVTLLFCYSVSGQTSILQLKADTLSGSNTEYSLTKLDWAFRSGDQIAWAQPRYSDTGWLKIRTNFGQGKKLKEWKGIGWFRLWVKVDTALTQKPLGLRINHDGASEIYIDGKYKVAIGKVGRNKSEVQIKRAPYEVVAIEFGDTKPHLIAIRYANYGHVFPDFIGFQTWIGDYEQMYFLNRRNYELFTDMWLCTSAQLALALLHLFLFLFYPKQKLNLYYVIFSVLFAGTNMAVSGDAIASNPLMQWWWQHIFWICGVLGTVSAWHLLYAVGHTRIPRWKSLVAVIFIIVFLVKKVIFMDTYPNDGFNLLFLLFLMDGLWALVGAIRRGQSNIWLIGLGIGLIIPLYFFVGADVFHLWTSRAERSIVMSVSLLSFPVLFSIYLALDFARTNINLSLKLQEVEELSNEKLELITKQAEKLERTVIERTAQVQKQADQLRELDEFKSRFFINLTHELRTPLTLIMGPAKQISSRNVDSQTKHDATTIGSNAERLLKLINQLLDLSKLEAGKLEIHNTSVELISVTRRNVILFQSLAEQKAIQLDFEADREQIWLSLDVVKLEGIIYNLLSNAIKFTRPGGKIMVSIKNSGTFFDLMVIDTGIGIPANKLPYIFDRFYQVDASDTRTQEGTGIGLAITKELTELMGGNLAVESIVGAGTTIKVSLPMHEMETLSPFSVESTTALIDFITPVATTREKVASDDQPWLLVIEDNSELREFISNILGANYQVMEAANGEEGLALGLSRIPDLVITDLMMPLMNGYQVCAGLKANEKTSHIPILMLTAKADTDSRIAGLEVQADAYLSKPFDQRELIATIENLISLRRRLQEKYQQGKIWLAETSTIPSMEQAFLEKIKNSVEAHLDDEQYSVDQLGDAIGLSRTQLHRKLKALTGQGPGELIRAVRLQRAHELLKQKAGTVSEIAYMVGFSNPNSFSTSFSKYFGFAPSEV